jgi:hypothetical protein
MQAGDYQLQAWSVSPKKSDAAFRGRLDTVSDRREADPDDQPTSPAPEALIVTG